MHSGGGATAAVPQPAAPATPRRSSAAQQAREAASRAGKATAPKPAAAPVAWEGAQGGPPYAPEYDAPARDPQYPGFDPGDEPLDDADQSDVRETSEETAVRLLAEAFGAERITDPTA